MAGRTCADVTGAREVGNGWGDGPVGMSERGCADVCRRYGCSGEKDGGMSERGCADMCGPESQKAREPESQKERKPKKPESQKARKPERQKAKKPESQ